MRFSFVVSEPVHFKLSSVGQRNEEKRRFSKKFACPDMIISSLGEKSLIKGGISIDL